MRLRCNNSSEEGFIFENSSEQALMSLRGNTGTLYLKGDIVGQRAWFSSGISVQEGITGASSGIRLWSSGDSKWGVYVAPAGTGQSMNGDTTQAAIDGATGHHVRFRCNNNSTSGFIFERSDNLVLMSLNATAATLRVYQFQSEAAVFCERVKATGTLFSGSCNVSGSGVADSQGAYIGWNRSVGTGETNFMNNRGGGLGGFMFSNFNSDGSLNNHLAQIDQNGSM